MVLSSNLRRKGVVVTGGSLAQSTSRRQVNLVLCFGRELSAEKEQCTNTRTYQVYYHVAGRRSLKKVQIVAEVLGRVVTVGEASLGVDLCTQ